LQGDFVEGEIALHLDLRKNGIEDVPVVDHLHSEFEGVTHIFVGWVKAKPFFILTLDDLSNEDDPAEGFIDVALTVL
jgi:hypothetical protein